jgi:hypothetical protein
MSNEPLSAEQPLLSAKLINPYPLVEDAESAEQSTSDEDLFLLSSRKTSDLTVDDCWLKISRSPGHTVDDSVLPEDATIDKSFLVLAFPLVNEGPSSSFEDDESGCNVSNGIQFVDVVSQSTPTGRKKGDLQDFMPPVTSTPVAKGLDECLFSISELEAEATIPGGNKSTQRDSIEGVALSLAPGSLFSTSASLKHARSPSAQGGDEAKKMRLTVDTDSVLVKLGKLYTYLWGENRIVYRAEMACSTLDLALFDPLNLNTRPDDILLVRNEYLLAYDHIASAALKNPTTKRLRSATLVTGQPGIGASTLECKTQHRLI